MSTTADPRLRLERELADRYALEREIGRGGMATVFLARDLRHERRVAIKVLHPDLAAILGAERFLAEITLTSFRCSTQASRKGSPTTSCPSWRARRVQGDSLSSHYGQQLSP